jgi:acyl carrier protein
MKLFTEEVIDAVGHVIALTDTSYIKPETRLEEDLGFDSGMYIELIMYLEDHIPGLTIDPSMLRLDDFLTVGSAAAFVSGLVQQSGAIS